jgi:DNA-binding MarR family transcriptional regulator
LEWIVKVQPEEEVRQFIAHMDLLSERLAPVRRKQDAAVAECSRQELKALAALGQRETLTMSDLAAILKVQLSTATHLIDKLAAKGLVERKRLKQDRRIVRVTFSRKGKRIHQYVVASRVAAARAMLEALNPAARRIFLRRMTKITERPSGADAEARLAG